MKKLLPILLLLGLAVPASAATVVAIADGNLTTAATWATTDATGNLISTSTSTTALTTGNLDSATFVLGASQVQGFMIRLGTRASGSPTNKMTVTLRNSTVPGTRDCAGVQTNVSDLTAVATTTDDNGGWYFYKCSANFTPNGTDSYLIRATLDSTSTAVALSTNGTANNWQRLIVRTTTGAPAAGDDMYISRVCDGANTPCTTTARSVTMDQTAATDYGTNNTNYRQAALNVGHGGTLTYGTTASTNYVLRLSGHLVVFSSGTLSIGTSGTPIPSTSTAILEFDCAADDDFGIEARSGTVNVYGVPRTAGKNFSWTLLTADAAASATSLTVQDDTGWLSGDQIYVASTTRTTTEVDARTLTSNAGASTLAVAALTNAHGGSASTKIQAEVIMTTRNVTIRAVTSTFQSFIHARLDSVGSVKWTQLDRMAKGNASTTAGMFMTSSGAWVFQYDSFTGGEDYLFVIPNSSADVPLTVDRCVMFNAVTTAGGNTILIGYNTNWQDRTWAFTNNVTIQDAGHQVGILLNDAAGTFSGNRHSGGNNAAYTLQGANSTTQQVRRVGTFSDIVIHSFGNVGSGIQFGSFVQFDREATFTNLTIWRSASIAINFSAGTTRNVHFNGCLMFGHTNTAFSISASLSNVRISGCTVAGDSTFAQAAGIDLAGGSGFTGYNVEDFEIENSTFGVASGSYVAHTAADIRFNANVYGSLMKIKMANVSLASTTEVSGLTDTSKAQSKSFVASSRHDQTSGVHKIYTTVGDVTYETTTVDVTPSIKMTPSSAVIKLDTAGNLRGRGFLVPVDSGQNPTFNVKVQKDGSYNGAAPRLIVRANAAVGVNTDTVLATCTVSSGSWTTCSAVLGLSTTDAGVLEYVIDCDGTAGNIFVDTVTVTGASYNDGGFKKWFFGIAEDGLLAVNATGTTGMRNWFFGIPFVTIHNFNVGGGGEGGGPLRPFAALWLAP